MISLSYLFSGRSKGSRPLFQQQHHSSSHCSISVAPSRKNSTNKPFCTLSASSLPPAADTSEVYNITLPLPKHARAALIISKPGVIGAH